MIPSQSGLWSAWDINLDAQRAETRDRFGLGRPSLIHQRYAAWREPRGPYCFDGVRALLQAEPRGSDGKEIIVDHSKKITRCKAIRRGDNVCFSPTDELFANLNTQGPLVIIRTQP